MYTKFATNTYELFVLCIVQLVNSISTLFSPPIYSIGVIDCSDELLGFGLNEIPLLYINNQELYTLQLGLQVFQGQVATQWNYLMAGSLLVLLPVIILFFTFQRYFIEGMDITAGTKG